MQCPYCKLNNPRQTKSVVCWNCRNYAENTQAQEAADNEVKLFSKYRWLPYGWQTYDTWRDDPTYLKQ